MKGSAAGGTGVAAGIAREFALAGALVLIASRKADNLAKVHDQIRPPGRCTRKPSAGMAATRALKRLGASDEIAYPCMFLASEASSYITGA